MGMQFSCLLLSSCPFQTNVLPAVDYWSQFEHPVGLGVCDLVATSRIVRRALRNVRFKTAEVNSSDHLRPVSRRLWIRRRVRDKMKDR